MKQLPVIVNEISLDKETDQSETSHTKFRIPFETNHIINNGVIRKYKKAGMLPDTTKSTTSTIPYTRRRKKRTGQTNNIPTPRNIGKNRRRCLRVLSSNYGQKGQPGQTCTSCSKTER